METRLPRRDFAQLDPASDPMSRPGSLEEMDRLSCRSRVEATMNRLKLFGERIMSREPDRQTAEIQIRIAIMNRCSALGRAETQVVA